MPAPGPPPVTGVVVAGRVLALREAFEPQPDAKAEAETEQITRTVITAKSFFIVVSRIRLCCVDCL